MENTVSTCCNIAINFQVMSEHIQQGKCSQCGTYYQKRTGSKILIKTSNGGEDWKCVQCESEIKCKDIHIPIHDGPFALSGSGRVKIVTLPYCPKCENL